MSKPPPVEYFEGHYRMPVLTAGPIMAQMTKIEGLEVSAPKLVTEVNAFTKNERSNHAIKAEDFLIDWLAANPTFRANEAVKAFRVDGRTDGSAYTALRILVEKKLLRKLGEGRYTTLAAKHQPKKEKGKQVQVRREVDHRTFVLRVASRNHGRFNTSWMKAQFTKDGRTPGNVSPTVAVLMKRKLIKRVGDSEYVLLQKAAPKKSEPVKKANGKAHDVTPVETAPGV